MFLYTNSEVSEKEMKTTIPFRIATNKIKYLGRNLKEVKDKEVKDLYPDYQTLLKEIKDIKK